MGKSYEGALSDLFAKTRYDAITRRKIVFTLKREQFRICVEGACYYCGAAPARHWFGYYFNGVDRIDNSKGYIWGNCISACSECNYIRGFKLTVHEAILAIRAVWSYRNGKGIVQRKPKAQKKRFSKEGTAS